MHSLSTVEHYRAKLLVKRSQVAEAIAKVNESTRTTGQAEVRDYTDRAVEREQTDAALQSESSDSETLQQVDDALRRLDAGTFGKCVICGKPIEVGRLRAIPW